MIGVIFWIQQCQRRIKIWQKLNFPIQLGFNSIQDHSWFFFILMNNRKIKWFKCPSRVVDKWFISGIGQDPVKSSERNFRKYLKTFAFSEMDIFEMDIFDISIFLCYFKALILNQTTSVSMKTFSEHGSRIFRFLPRLRNMEHQDFWFRKGYSAFTFTLVTAVEHLFRHK